MWLNLWTFSHGLYWRWVTVGPRMDITSQYLVRTIWQTVTWMWWVRFVDPSPRDTPPPHNGPAGQKNKKLKLTSSAPKTAARGSKLRPWALQMISSLYTNFVKVYGGVQRLYRLYKNSRRKTRFLVRLLCSRVT